MPTSENPHSRPCCCGCAGVDTIAWPLRIFFPGHEGEKVFFFLKEAWPGRGGRETGSGRSPGAPGPQHACSGRLGKQALPVGTARKFSLTREEE